MRTGKNDARYRTDGGVKGALCFLFKGKSTKVTKKKGDLPHCKRSWYRGLKRRNAGESAKTARVSFSEKRKKDA